jgi:hypothetical protein
VLVLADSAASHDRTQDPPRPSPEPPPRAARDSNVLWAKLIADLPHHPKARHSAVATRRGTPGQWTSSAAMCNSCRIPRPAHGEHGCLARPATELTTVATGGGSAGVHAVLTATSHRSATMPLSMPAGSGQPIAPTVLRAALRNLEELLSLVSLIEEAQPDLARPMRMRLDQLRADFVRMQYGSLNASASI